MVRQNRSHFPLLAPSLTLVWISFMPTLTQIMESCSLEYGDPLSTLFRIRNRVDKEGAVVAAVQVVEAEIQNTDIGFVEPGRKQKSR